MGDQGQIGPVVLSELVRLVQTGVVRAEKQLPNGLHLTKEFQPTSNYLVSASAIFENRGTQAIALPAQEWVVT